MLPFICGTMFMFMPSTPADLKKCGALSGFMLPMKFMAAFGELRDCPPSGRGEPMLEALLNWLARVICSPGFGEAPFRPPGGELPWNP